MSSSANQIINLGESFSLASIYIKELRCSTIQNDRMRFRQNIFRLGQIAAYEISKTLNNKQETISTVLAETEAFDLADQPIIATVLRAGLPLYDGVLSCFDKADSAFISAYRKHDQYDEFEIKMTSISCPDINNRTVILCDPMLATGQSLVRSVQELLKLGSPCEIIICTVIASKEGMDYFTKKCPNCRVYTFAIDPELNVKSYIVPGLGDAGDLAFGPKIQA